MNKQISKQELTYWVTFAMMSTPQTYIRNQIFEQLYKKGLDIIQLFDNPEVWNYVGELRVSRPHGERLRFVTDEEKFSFRDAEAELRNNAFLVNSLLEQGYNIIPIIDDRYPKLLKKTRKRYSPLVIFTKGNTALLNKEIIAIIGSRNAEEISLNFTNNVARKAVSEGKVVVSGFAKGIDRKALDSTLEAGGSSIIVLPQGITTIGKELREYYPYIVDGKLLVISSFSPNAGWNKGLAMARNSIIYGMAKDIYVAQSASKGGTWSCVNDGLKFNNKNKEKGFDVIQTFKVRYPSFKENNANKELIEEGAVPVDINGNDLILDYGRSKMMDFIFSEDQLQKIVGSTCFSAKEIKSRLKLDDDDEKIETKLRSLPYLSKNKRNEITYFQIKSVKENDGLFAHP